METEYEQSQQRPEEPAEQMVAMGPSSRVRAGLAVLHLFANPSQSYDPEDALRVVKDAQNHGAQVMTVALLGHRAQTAVMALHPDLRVLRELQVGLVRAGLVLGDSFLSITEVSEYSQHLSEERKRPRLYPELPPAGLPNWCFYPMLKRREGDFNWYALPYQERERLMYGHGASGRKFAGRVLQLVTGATGLSEWEWGVTLFAERPDDIKDVVYTLRYDEASARYGEFGRFYVGYLDDPAEVLARA